MTTTIFRRNNSFIQNSSSSSSGGGGGGGGAREVAKTDKRREGSERGGGGGSDFEQDIILCPQKLFDRLLMVCPNAEFCQEVLPRSDLQWHLINRCKGVITNCINANIGCSFQGTRASLQLHLKECLYNKRGGRVCWQSSGRPQSLPSPPLPPLPASPPPASPPPPPASPPSRITFKIYSAEDHLGISIVGGTDTPLVSIIVQEIFKQGSAYKDGRLKEGDQLLEVNGVDLKTVRHQTAVDALTPSAPGPSPGPGPGAPAVFEFTVFRETSDQSPSSAPPPPPPLPLKCIGRKDRFHSIKKGINGIDGTAADNVSEGVSRNSFSVSRQRLSPQQPFIASSPSSSSSSSSLDLETTTTTTTTMTTSLVTWPLEEWKEHVIEVENVGRDSLGISIAGGRFSCGYDVPIYVTNVQPNGCLALSGQMAKGDVLVRINDLDLVHLTHSEATSVLKRSADEFSHVTVDVIRSRGSSSSSSSSSSSTAGNFKPRWTFWLSLPSSCHSKKTLTLERSTSGSLGFAIVGGYETSSPASSSSDSLVTSFVPIFVRSVLHNGPAAKDGRLKSGDMLLSVDGVSLADVGHNEAVRLLTAAEDEASASASVTLTVVSWPGTLV